VAITYPLSLPSARKFRTANWRERDVTADAASPFTGQSQVVVWPGQWVECTLTLVAMRESDAAAWGAWITSLAGHAGTFLLGYPPRSVPLGSARWTPGTPLVNGGGQTGNALAIDGLPASRTGYLKAGDFVQLGSGSTSQFYKLLEDANSNASGQATLTLWPNLRSAPADNAAVVVSGAKGLFHRMSAMTEWSVGPDGITQQRSFDVKERLS
jgi:hypothetical protein